MVLSVKCYSYINLSVLPRTCYITPVSLLSITLYYYIQIYSNQIPTRRLGVAVIRAPAPIPVCRGVPGTITLELLPLDALAACAFSSACFALLFREQSVTIRSRHKKITYSSRWRAISVSSSTRFENSRSACLLFPRSSKFFSLTE